MTETEREDRLALADAWIEREFAGYGRAIRRQDEPPFPDEPYMSMADAKELTCRAIAHFAALHLSPVMGGMREALAALDLAHSVLPNGSVRSKIWKASTDLKAALSAPHPQARGEDYREAIDEALVVRHLGIAKGEARKELNDILSWEVAVALDSRVSEAAQSLIDSGRTRPSEATAGREAVAWLAENGATTTDPRVMRTWRNAKPLYALPASCNGVDTDEPNTKPQSPVGHYTGRPIT